jgi:DsbC/DsbD-like thiol-disulfide interchange protein
MRWWCAFVLMILAMAVRAEEKNPLQVEMISEVSQIRAGQTFFVGFHLRHPPGYHSYWKHPGVVGVATKISWQLPDGFRAGEILWPAPQKVMMSIHPAQGYRGDVLLMVPITAPAGLFTGSITLRAEVDWMCCARSCHPAHRVPFSLTLRTGTDAITDGAHAKLFEETRRHLPKPDERWSASAVIDAEEITLTIRPAPGNPRRLPELGDLWFFSADGAVDSSEPQHTAITADGALELRLARYEFGPAQATHLTGVLQAVKGWQVDGSVPFIEINAPIKR